MQSTLLRDNSVPVPTAISAVDGELGQLTEAVDQLVEIVAHLEDRLGPVLSPARNHPKDQCASPEKATAEPELAHVAASVRSRRNAVRSTNERLREILLNLEV